MRNTSALKNQKGSAIQLALIASTIFSLGAYSLITVSETSTKVTNSYVASSLVESLSTTLSSAIHNRRSYFVSSAKQPNKLPKDCLLDYMSTTCIPLAGSTNTPADRGGTFDLYSSSQTLISGEYNAYGHNCSDSAWANEDVCSSSQRIIAISPISYKIVAVDRAANVRDKFYISYSLVNLKSGKVYGEYWLNKVDYEIENIYQKSICPTGNWVSTIGPGGDVECSPIDSYAGVMGPRGPRGVTGDKGPVGNRGNRGAVNLVRSVGCFDGDAPVKMWDGSLKPIRALTRGETVYNPISRYKSKISSIFVGPETEPVFQIDTQNFSVTVTKTHPILTKNIFTGVIETKSAEEILARDMVATDHGFEFVKNISFKKQKEGYQVYNLVLEDTSSLSEHFISAGGIIAGDMVLQNRFSEQNLAQD